MARIVGRVKHIKSVRQFAALLDVTRRRISATPLYRIASCDPVSQPPVSQPIDMSEEILSVEDVRHIARLAALRIDEEEVQTMRRQLSDILAHFQTLAELDTEGVAPTGHTTDAHTVMREDDEMPAMDRNQTLSNAPFVDGEFVRVRPVIE